jgi:hypothetical protein
MRAVLLTTSSNDYVNVSMWNMHLNYESYGPYAACSWLCDDESQIMAGELALAMGGQGEEAQ